MAGLFFYAREHQFVSVEKVELQTINMTLSTFVPEAISPVEEVEKEIIEEEIAKEPIVEPEIAEEPVIKKIIPKPVVEKVKPTKQILHNQPK